MAIAQPQPVTADTQAASVARAGRNELGTISVPDSVVTKIAARAAAENPDAGAAAARMLGQAVPGASSMPGVRNIDLEGLPKTTVDVDGSKAFITLELSVRWPASIPEVTAQVRSHVRDRVQQLAGLDVDEVHIVVEDLATDITSPPRVR
jgi:uncharacterized alkaline shock family protein YloU